MTKELQDIAWSVLPKEFKDEVKVIYASIIKMMDMKPSSEVYAGQLSTLESIFGIHNLTSDQDENAEILCVFRKRAQELYAKAKKADDASSYFGGYEDALEDLFGDKYMPDDSIKLHASCEQVKEPKPDEPKFHVGDIVRFKYCCTPYRIDGFKMLDGAMLYQVGEVWAEESDLEPYAESTDNPIPSNSRELNSQEANSQSDHILKASFSKELRLNIATQFCTAMLSNPALTNLMTAPGNIAELAIKSTDIFLDEYEKGLTE